MRSAPSSLIPSLLLLVPGVASAQELPHLFDLGPADAGAGQLLVRAAAPDGSGGGFVASWLQPPGGDEPARLARVDPSGATTWGISFGATSPLVAGGSFRTRVNALAPDGAGGVFAAGEVGGQGFAGAPRGGGHGFVARFDGQGALSWAVRVGDSGNETVFGLCPDGSGGVFAVGQALGGAYGGPSSVNLDAFVARFDANGAQLFATRHVRPFISAWFSSATPDGAGGVLCGGNTLRQNPAYNTVLTARFDGSGAEQWSIDDNGFDFWSADVASDGAGGFYLVGSAYHASGPDEGLVERRSATGQVLWSRTIGLCGLPFCGRLTTVHAVEVAHDGTVIVAGQTEVGNAYAHGFVARFTDQGDLLDHHIVDHGPAHRHGRFAGIALDGAGRLLAFGDRTLLPGFERFAMVARLAVAELGAPVGAVACPAAPNSTGQTGIIRAVGLDLASANDVTLWAAQLPDDVFGIFVVSQTPGFTPLAGGSGNLCLDGAIGRFNRPGEILFSGDSGAFELDVDLTSFPVPGGPVQVMPGETWFFQAWHRDAAAGPTSNYTDALEIVWQ